MPAGELAAPKRIECGERLRGRRWRRCTSRFPGGGSGGSKVAAGAEKRRLTQEQEFSDAEAGAERLSET